MTRLSKIFKPEYQSKDDPLTIIDRGLRSLSNTKSIGSAVMICCPFHLDRNPSCGVNTSSTGTVPVGAFHCFSCGEKGLWNKLADRLGLEKIPAWSQNTDATQTLMVDENVQKILDKLGSYQVSDPTEDALVSIAKKLKVKSYSDWSRYSGWRGFEGSFLKTLGALSAVSYWDSIEMILPVKVMGVLRGAVLAYVDKPDKGPSYINSPGKWTGDFGLFPYDYVFNMCLSDDYPAVFMVEGPRDAMRYLREGYPALAVLGASSFSEKKAELLSRLRTKTLAAVPDNDLGGETFAARFIKTFDAFANHSALPVNIEVINLPKTKRKIDPFSMSDKVFKATCRVGGYNV